jgi:phosphomannomutase
MSVRNADGRLIATHSGLRGRPGAGLDGAVVRQLVGEFLSLLAERGLPRTVGLARDARPSGERLAAQAIEEARRQGADIVDFGVVSTPTAKRAARSSGLGGGIIVTGSHLGPDWNGIKLVAAPDYWPIDTSRLPATSTAPEGPTGALHRDRTADEVHAAAVCDAVDADAIRRANLRVSLSGGCGRAAHLALERLGCSLVEDEADLGLVIDGDGDRLQLVDERSNRLDTEVTFRSRRSRSVRTGWSRARIRAGSQSTSRRNAAGRFDSLRPASSICWRNSTIGTRMRRARETAAS